MGDFIVSGIYPCIITDILHILTDLKKIEHRKIYSAIMYMSLAKYTKEISVSIQKDIEKRQNDYAKRNKQLTNDLSKINNDTKMDDDEKNEKLSIINSEFEMIESVRRELNEDITNHNKSIEALQRELSYLPTFCKEQIIKIKW